MKPLCLLLSFYVLFLTALPCADRPEDFSMAQGTFSAINSHAHGGDIDHCSPFCTCNCCSSPKIQTETAVIFDSQPVVLQRLVVPAAIHLSPQIDLILQPPQLV